MAEAQEHPSISRFRDAHSQRGGTGSVVGLPESAHTAALAAQALGCEIGAIANSLLFEAEPSSEHREAEPSSEHREAEPSNEHREAEPSNEHPEAEPSNAHREAEPSREPSTGGPVLILTSGAHRVDTAFVAATIGVAALRRASPDFVREHTGQVIGGVSPIGHPAPVPTFVDSWLRRHPVVWAAAGHPASVFSTTFDELVAMTGGAEIDVAPGDGA